jgi:hypothetical protein
MFLKKFLPLIVAGYMVGIGIFFLTVFSFISSPAYIDLPSKTILRATSALLVGGGALSIYLFLFQKKKPKKEDKKTVEARKEIVGKLISEPLLTDIALKDPSPEIREAARRRLEALNINWPAVRVVSG